MKVNHAIKAKKETFRERNLRKVENVPFWAHLNLQILDRDENHFLMNIFQNLVPNSNLRALSAELKVHAPAFRTERHHPPAGPASTQEILIPCAGVAPPHSNKPDVQGIPEPFLHFGPNQYPKRFMVSL